MNVAENAPVPRCGVKGHCWKQIVHNNEVTWLAYYRDASINEKKPSTKYIFLAASSKFKGENDRKKYEKARILKTKIADIRIDYKKKIKSRSKAARVPGAKAHVI